MSKLNDLLDACVAIQNTLALSVGGTVVTNVKRKLPKREETVDSSYMVTVNGAELVDAIRRAAFGGKYFVTYTIELTLVTPNDRDQLINLADHAAWRETTRAKYMTAGTLSGVGAVMRVEIASAPFLDRSELAVGYDYTQVVLSVQTYETRVP